MSVTQVINQPTPDIISDQLRINRSSLRLVEAVQALSMARSLAAIIEIVRKSARDLACSDGASFILRDGDRCHYVDEDSISPLWKGQRFPMSACVSGWAMLHRRPTAITDIYQDPRVPYDAYRPTFVKSLVMVPIRTEEPVGAIGLYWAEEHAASDEEIELLQALANSTAVAMESVRLYSELESRVQERTRQLEEANRELESFSYSVSHDLQAPLRHITAFTDFLVQDYSARLDDKGREYPMRVQTSADRMGQLIHDLLRLARFARTEFLRGPVDLTQMARSVEDQLRAEAPQRSVEFHVPDGLTASGDATLLRVVLENLLANAWKFTSKREHAVIEFGARLLPDGTAAWFVKDNGAGFDLRHASRLFGVFQRMHAERDFSGTGIGLATVDRIIRRHGGRIWAEAQPDRGATFLFTLGEPLASPLG